MKYWRFMRPAEPWRTCIAQEFGIEPAAPDEARDILGLKGLQKVVS
jgi:hypothetical protein